MYFSNHYICDTCGDKRDLPTNAYNGGYCLCCEYGIYHKCGETYDHEWIESQEDEKMDRI